MVTRAAPRGRPGLLGLGAPVPLAEPPFLAVLDGVVDALVAPRVGQHRHVGLSRLEDVQNVVHGHPSVHPGQRVELDLGGQDRDLVVRVEEQELLGDDEADDVLPAPRDVDGDPRVPRLHDGLDDRPVQHGVRRQHEGDGDRGHRHEGGLVRQAERARDDLHLVPAELAPLALHPAVELNKCLELLPLHEAGVVLADHVVQEFAERVRDHAGGVHQDLNERREAAADGEAELLAQGLWEDLAEEEHGGDGDRDGDDLVGDLVQEDRQGLHGHGVAQQQRHEEPVLALEHRHDPLGVLPLLLRAALYQNEEVDLLEAEQAEG
mmetsp:Transcript_1877/g.6338  ORF Transcript_1877/g.6338 Transcript_1877/m.6338 type:complete len:321 (+) Transcript_1877:473-1435(+)